MDGACAGTIGFLVEQSCIMERAGYYAHVYCMLVSVLYYAGHCRVYIAEVQTMQDAPDPRRHPRTVMATDTEWRRIRERAEAAGMPISRFICQRAAGPEPRPPPGVAPEAVLARLERIETAVLVLAEIERQRLAERGEEEGWEAAARRVGLRLRAERPVAGDAPS